MSKPSTDGLRREAWHFGRSVRDDLVDGYRRKYRVRETPPPAVIVDELLTDFLGVRLNYDPLQDSVYAETARERNGAVVTINSLTADIPGVKDPEGVQNVGKWHELIHVMRDSDTLRDGPQLGLPRFDEQFKTLCYRGRTGRDWRREFWAEEAGRAAAVCHDSLSRSRAFQALTDFARGVPHTNAEAWELIRQAATDIGVNRSALVTQLRLEGQLTVEKREGRRLLVLQPNLVHWMEA